MTLFIVLAALFVYVLATNEVTRLHKAYLVFHFLMMLWPFFIYLVNYSAYFSLEWLFLKTAFVGISFASYAWLIFAVFLTGFIDRIGKKLVVLAAVPAILSAATVTVNPYYRFVSMGPSGWADHMFGPLFWLVIAIQVLYAVAAVGLILKTRQVSANRMVREQLGICLIGCLFFCSFTIADILINVVFSAKTIIPAMSSMGTTLMMVCFAVAITNYDLVRIFSIAQREIIDNMAVGIVVLDNEGTIVGKNQSAEQYFDLRVGQDFAVDQLLALADDQDYSAILAQHYKSGEIENWQAEMTLGQETKNRILCNVVKMEGDGKKSLGRIITLSDITEIHNLLDEIREKNLILEEQNDELRRIQKELVQVEQSRRNLLSNIAHDLRSPMTHIQGYLQAILEGVFKEPEQQNRCLESVYWKAVGLSRLIDDLFQLSQLESRQVSCNLCPMRADELVAKLVRDNELEARTVGIEVDLEILPCTMLKDEAYPLVNVDSGRFNQVFANIFSNAIKHVGSDGKITISLEPVWAAVKLAEKGAGERISALEGPKCEEVLIAVHDNGPGIPAEDLPHIFDRFYKGKNTTQAESYGIGLAIAKEIVAIHNGQIWAESEVGQGSTFYIKLPVQPQALPSA